MNFKKVSLISIIALVILLALYFFVDNKVEENKESKIGEGIKLTMYKSPNCGCCAVYERIMKKKGFEFESIMVDDMTEIKDKYKIPADKQSCHTMTMGDYYVEGHVPADALVKLFNEKPDIKGIGLPGMPAGTPGMGGVKNETWVIYQDKEGEFSDFMRI